MGIHNRSGPLSREKLMLINKREKDLQINFVLET